MYRGGLAAGLVSAALVLVAVLVAGCTGGQDTANLPAGGTLLATSGRSMAGVHSVHFTIDVHGNLPSVPVQDAAGDLNSAGQAKGNAKLTELGQLVQVDFVLTGGELYLKGPTGGYQKIPAALATRLFDPTAILDPKRGVAKLLTSVRDPATQDRENGSYRVTGTVGKDVVGALVPGINSDVRGTFWVSTAPSALPSKAEFTVPGTNGTAGATVDVAFSQLNQPVSVSAPS
jgi:lipoprotein LprG